MKKKILFASYSIILIIVLALFLILHNQKKEEIIYAESVTINGPREISMSVNTEIELLSGFITVEPADIVQNMAVSVKSKSNSNAGGLSFKDNLITANKLGYYSVTFSFKSSATKDISETINVRVLENINDVTIKSTNLYLDELTSIDSLISVNTQADINLKVDDKVELTNSFLKASELGKTTIQVSLTKNFLKHIYSYSFNIVPKDDFKITLVDISKDENNYKLELIVTNRDNTHCEADLTILSSTNVSTNYCEYPIITIVPTKSGKVNLVVCLREHPDITLTIEFDTW